MSNNIEDNIVSMQFDNKQFESGVATSLGTMDKLKSSLTFPDAGKGLADVNSAVGRFNMNPMAAAIQGVSKLWIGLTTVAVTAISNITNKVVDGALNMAKGFTIDPITQGFGEYEKKLNSIQTIMANTGSKIAPVSASLADLNAYSDKTIYNFGQMADSIGKFTAAGVDLKPAVDAIKGMANSAALAGSDVNQLNTAMYQMSQALGTGTIRLMDWNSLANAGMGGENMRESLMKTAETMKDHGAAMQAAIDKNGSFRDSLQDGWLSAEIFTKTMKVMAGQTVQTESDLKKIGMTAKEFKKSGHEMGDTIAYTVEQLQKMGYSKDAAKQLHTLSGAAIDSATKVKTFTQLIGVVKESIGSGWARVFEDLFGNFEEATKMWTAVSNSITGTVGNIFASIDKVLVGWRDLGGYQDLWAGIGNIFKILGNLMHPVIVLFQALTPNTGKAGSGLAKVTSIFADFTGTLVKLTDGIGNWNPKFSAMGKIIGTIGDVFSAVIGPIKAFVSALEPLLPILAKLGDYVGDLFDQGMDIAGNLIAGWTQGLDPQALKDAAIDLANTWITAIKDVLGIHSPAESMIPIGMNIIQGIVEGLTAGAQFLIGALQKIFAGVGQALKWIVANIEWSDVLDTINTLLYGGLLITFRGFVKAFTGTLTSFQGIMGKAGGVLDQITGNLKAMQQKVKSEVIRNIAISVALLAGAAFLLASLDAKKLGLALGAIGGMMAGLVGAMKVLQGKNTKDMNPKAIAAQGTQLVLLGAAMVEFSTAIVILTGAVALMGKLKPGTIARGLAGVSGVILAITAATAILAKSGGGGTILATATAMLVMAAALTAFVGVMKLYEKLDWKTLVRGGGSAAAVIVGIGLALRGFGKGAVGGSVALVVASAALIILAKAMQMFASIGIGDMIKSVIALDFILASIAGAAALMTGAQSGGVAMLIMAAAIIVLAKALEILASISVGDTIKAVLTLVVLLGVIAGAAFLLAPAVPLIAALGTAVLLFGAAAFLAGTGILAFAAGMGILAVVGPAAFQALHDGILQMLDVLPEVGTAMAGFVVGFITGFVRAAKPLTKALGELLDIILDALIKLVPKAGKLIRLVIAEIIQTVAESYGRLFRAAIHLLLGMMDALIDAVPKFIKKGTDLVIAVITGLGKAGKRIVNAMGQTVLDFLGALDQAIVKYEPQIFQQGAKIGLHIVEGAAQGIWDAADMIKDAMVDIAKDAWDAAKDFLHIGSPSRLMRETIGQMIPAGLALGIKDKAHLAADESENMAKTAVDSLHSTFKKSMTEAGKMMDLQPKVSPVLDLTQLEKDAKQIGSRMGHHTLNADVSRKNARDIAADHMARRRGDDGPEGGDSYNFNQYISSPEPVNHIKAYRGTKSQIALFKEVAGK